MVSVWIGKLGKMLEFVGDVCPSAFMGYEIVMSR